MTRPEPHWLGRLAVDEAHFRQVREHGGAYGLRDEALLKSALARPRHRWQYQPEGGLADVAAAHASGLIRDHPYTDGNKRIALVVMVAFLERNGVDLTATNPDPLLTVLAVAAGNMIEGEFADWIPSQSRTL